MESSLSLPEPFQQRAGGPAQHKHTNTETLVLVSHCVSSVSSTLCRLAAEHHALWPLLHEAEGGRTPQVCLILALSHLSHLRLSLTDR